MTKKNIIKPIFSLFVILIFIQPVFSCEPCEEILQLKATVNKAELVIVGKRKDLVSEGLTDPNKANPTQIELSVLRVLKGKLDSKIITVNSWYGMCDYGIVLNDNKPYVIFLVKEGTSYSTVAHGCAVKLLPIEDNKVIIDDSPFTLEEFINDYDL